MRVLLSTRHVPPVGSRSTRIAFTPDPGTPTRSEYDWDAVRPGSLATRLSVTVTVKVKFPVCVGVPVIAPVVGLNDTPGGRDPALIAYESGVTPLAAIAVLYAISIVASVSAVVVMAAAGKVWNEATCRSQISWLLFCPPVPAENPNLTVGSANSSAGAFTVRVGGLAALQRVFTAQTHTFTCGVETVDGSTTMRTDRARSVRLSAPLVQSIGSAVADDVT